MSTSKKRMGRRSLLLLGRFLMMVFLIGSSISQCVDVDQKAYNITGSNLTETTRDKLSALGYYCDITVSWKVTNATVFDESKHKAAYVLYQQLYAQTTSDSIEGERKDGVNKDCLAFSYKAFCAYTIPKCSDGKDVNKSIIRNQDYAQQPATL
jgi:hypothetical protein